MTADMVPVVSAVQTYGDARAAEGAASRQGEVDSLQSSLAALQSQFDAYKAAHPTPVTLTVAATAATSEIAVDWTCDPGTHTISGFLVGRDGQSTNGSGPWETPTPVAAGPVTLKNLIPGTLYDVHVTPIVDGTADPSVQGVASARTDSVPAALFGAFPGFDNKAKNPGETLTQRRARLTAAWGPLAIQRLFQEGNLGQPPLVGPSIVSWTLPPADVAAGKYDSQLQTLFAGLPTDYPIWCVLDHEHDNKIKAGTYTAAQFKAGYARFVQLGRAAGKANLQFGPVYMRFTLGANSGANWLDSYPGDDLVDFIGWDCYAGTGFKTVADTYQQAHDVTVAHGKQFLVPETSIWATAGWTEQQWSSFVSGAVDYLKTAAAGVCWFESNKEDGDWRLIPHTAASSVWADAVANG